MIGSNPLSFCCWGGGIKIGFFGWAVKKTRRPKEMGRSNKQATQLKAARSAKERLKVIEDARETAKEKRVSLEKRRREEAVSSSAEVFAVELSKVHASTVIASALTHWRKRMKLEAKQERESYNRDRCEFWLQKLADPNFPAYPENVTPATVGAAKRAEKQHFATGMVTVCWSTLHLY